LGATVRWFVLSLLISSTAFAAQKRLAVLQFEVQKGLELDRETFTDFLQDQTVKAAPDLFVMTQANIEMLVQAAGKTLDQCEGQCAVETGKLIQADLIISGRISRVGKTFAISMQLYDTASGELISGESGKAKDEDELLEVAASKAASLLEKLGGNALGKAAQAQAPVAAAPAQRASGAPKTPSPAGDSRLKIVTIPPGSDVFVDGELKGKAPLTLTVEPSSYHVRIEQNGYLPAVRNPDVTAGHVTLVTVELTPGKAPEAEAPVRAAASTRPTRLRIHANVEADCTAGDLRIHVLPALFALMEVPSGPVHLVCSSPGYEEKATQMTVKPGKVHLVRLVLEAKGSPAAAPSPPVDDKAMAEDVQQATGAPPAAVAAGGEGLGKITINVNVDSDCTFGATKLHAIAGVYSPIEVPAGQIRVTCSSPGYTDGVGVALVKAGRLHHFRIALRPTNGAMPALFSFQAVTPSDKAATLLEEGDAKGKRGDQRGAIALYQEGLKLRPMGSVRNALFRGLGIAYTAVGDGDNAAQYYRAYLPFCTDQAEHASIQRLLADHDKAKR
jgi:hypothetical protein